MKSSNSKDKISGKTFKVPKEINLQIKNKVYNLIILDESGSMESIKSNIISGFNEVIQTIKNMEKKFPEQEHFISFITFNGTGIKTILKNQPVKKAAELNEKMYKPNSLTPLFDAIGTGINNLRNKIENEKNCDVLVTILTDGLENASKEYSGKQIKELIEILKMNNWTFTYIGTDHDIDKVADSISINNTISFNRDEISMKAMFVKESELRMMRCEEISEKHKKINLFE
ncbi:MAG: VWA domain-containing protein [Ignavibacteria bacterium]|nr:VWA domain-containing protein [Ignavibacteria bacterium]